MTAQPGPWNSLEIAKLVVSALTPAVVVLWTRVVSTAWRRAERREQEVSRREERAEWLGRRSIERIVELHTSMAPLLNDICCFVTRVGHFRGIDPPVLIQKKAELDRLFFVNQHLFSRRFRDGYAEFMAKCFEEEPGGLVKLITSERRLKSARGGPGSRWDDRWGLLFVPEPHDAEAVRGGQQEAYDEAMSAFAQMLGFDQEWADGPPPGGPAGTRASMTALGMPGLPHVGSDARATARGRRRSRRLP